MYHHFGEKKKCQRVSDFHTQSMAHIETYCELVLRCSKSSRWPFAMYHYFAHSCITKTRMSPPHREYKKIAKQVAECINRDSYRSDYVFSSRIVCNIVSSQIAEIKRVKARSNSLHDGKYLRICQTHDTYVTIKCTLVRRLFLCPRPHQAPQHHDTTPQQQQQQNRKVKRCTRKIHQWDDV